MNNSYQWGIRNMECVRVQSDHTNVVHRILWSRTASSDGFNAIIMGTVDLPEPSEEFVEYNDLTKDIVEGWLNSVLIVEEINEILDAQIENMKNPPLISLPLPWIHNK